MVSSFYSSNQQKLKKYTADRRVEEHNGDIQQAKVYQKIAEENQDIEAADRLAKLGMNIMGKVASTTLPIVNKQGGVAKMTVKEHITSMIESGSLSSWWDSIKRIPPTKLSKKARIVQDDIKHNEMLKQTLNELVSKVALSGVPGAQPLFKQGEIVPGIISKTKKQAFVDEMIKLLSGGDEAPIQELDNLALEEKGTTPIVDSDDIPVAVQLPKDSPFDKFLEAAKNNNMKSFSGIISSLTKNDKNLNEEEFKFLLSVLNGDEYKTFMDRAKSMKTSKTYKFLFPQVST